MKSGKTIAELAAEIMRRAENKKDIVLKTDKITMAPNTSLVRIDPTGLARERSAVRLNLAGQMNVGVNGIAHTQIATHTDIPKKYYDRMLSEDSELLCKNVNAWFQRDPTPRMVRMLDNRARALLSDRFRPIENEELAETVLPVIADLDLAVMSCEVTDRRLYLKCVNKKVERELAAIGGKFGDGKHKIVRCLSPAITISNSEVGLGALSVLGGVYDGFCSNLASFGERSTRKYHVGAKNDIGEDSYHLLSDDTKHKTNVALLAQIRDVVKGAFDRANFDALCDKIGETQTHKIDGDPIKCVTLATRKFGINETEGKSVLKHLVEGADLSRFGLYNAITRASQDLPDYDRATEFERFGAQVIELPKTEWHAMANAA